MKPVDVSSQYWFLFVCVDIVLEIQQARSLLDLGMVFCVTPIRIQIKGPTGLKQLRIGTSLNLVAPLRCNLPSFILVSWPHLPSSLTAPGSLHRYLEELDDTMNANISEMHALKKEQRMAETPFAIQLDFGIGGMPASLSAFQHMSNAEKESQTNKTTKKKQTIEQRITIIRKQSVPEFNVWFVLELVHHHCLCELVT